MFFGRRSPDKVCGRPNPAASHSSWNGNPDPLCELRARAEFQARMKRRKPTLYNLVSVRPHHLIALDRAPEDRFRDHNRWQISELWNQAPKLAKRYCNCRQSTESQSHHSFVESKSDLIRRPSG